MYDHRHLAALQAQSLAQQDWIRSQTYAPGQEKRLRRFSSWEVAELILKVNASTLRSRIAADPVHLPQNQQLRLRRRPVQTELQRRFILAERAIWLWLWG